MEQLEPQNTARPTKATFLVCVSDQQESEVALRFACLRAKKRQANLAILHVIEPGDMPGLFSVADVMQQEKEEAAQALLNHMADLALQACGTAPSLILKEGNLGEEIVKTTLENGDIVLVVLGVHYHSLHAPKLLSWLTSKLGQELLVPIILVPGNLTDDQIESLV